MATAWLEKLHLDKTTVASVCPEPHVRLEKFSLPCFDGDVLSFISFWETFDSRVHSNPHLNSIDKFDYLISRCKGRASEAIAAIPRTSSGYDLAVETLKRRFGRRAPIIDSCLTELIELKRLPDDCSIAELRNMLDVINVRVRTLLGLGLDAMGGAEWIGPVLVARLPHRVRLRWEEKMHETYKDKTGGLCPDLFIFLEFFHQMVEIEEAMHAPSGPKKGPLKLNPATPRTSSPKTNFRATKATLTSSFTTHAKPRTCRLCDASDHVMGKCPSFLNSSVDDRKQHCRRLFLCFNCLASGHSVDNCSSNSRCRQCNGKHHTLLHFVKTSPDTPLESKVRPVHIVSNASMSLPVSESGRQVILQSCQAYGHGPKGDSGVIRVLFDSCSNFSFIRKETAQRLNLSEEAKMPMTINTFGCNIINRDFSVCSLELSPASGGRDSPRKSMRVIVADDLVHPIQGHKIDLSRYEHLNTLTIPEDHSSGAPLTIDVIVGADYYHDFVLHRRKKGGLNEPVAVKTILGWTLHGPYSKLKDLEEEPCISTSLFCDLQRRPTSMVDELEKLWAMESINVSDDREDDWVQPEFQNGRISTCLPWKSSERPLTNKKIVASRQTNTNARLTPSQTEQLTQYFEDLEERDMIETCSTPNSDNSWYLPHHCVWQRKLRVVFDGSFGHPSLNDLLQTGPNLLNVIPVCLTSFRLHALPITADLEKAFLQIEIKETDRDFLRFTNEGTDFRFRRVPFGLNCSPALLNSSLKLLYDSFQNDYPETIHRLRHCTYVDDVVTSFPDEKSLQEFKTQSTELFSKATMNLRGWSSEPERVLGIRFDSATDELVLNLTRHPVFSATKFSRREVLSYTSSLFDPLGLWLPWTIRLRSLLQDSWRLGLSWDEPFPADLQENWQQLMQEASFQQELRHDRWVHFDEHSSSMHVFSDASQLAYATCVYLLSPKGSYLLYSRSRVTPLKPVLTTPRAELMAALLSARAVTLLRSNLPTLTCLPTFFWSDSTCVLSWLRSDPSRLKLFVRNRVVEILQVEGEWLYVPTGENPADIVSRGIGASALSSSLKWRHGPTWLGDRELWPKQSESLPTSMEVLVASATEATVEKPPDSSNGLTQYPVKTLLQRNSSLEKVVRIWAWALRFLRNVRKKHDRQLNNFLLYEERKEALDCLIRIEQEQHFPSEVAAVREGSLVQRSSPLRLLRPTWHELQRLLVTTPRTNEAPKIFLPPTSRVTQLIVRDIHERTDHAGVDRTLAIFQCHYWTCRSRVLIKRVVRECRKCIRVNPPAYAQLEGKLPDFRSEFSRPFQHVGLDHAGPLHLRDGRKVYVLLFTCASVRAVHLELVDSLSTEETAKAFRRFQSRRGVPSEVYSDNAACFKRLAPLVDSSWHFIPERSPAWGGWWERMVQTVKRSLRKVVGKASLEWSELFTVLIEIEGHINQRPLTYVADHVDSVSALTPGHFLGVQQPLGAPWASSSAEALGKRWVHCCKVASDLKQRWTQEYLPSLRQWRGHSSSGSQPKVGDVVLVAEGAKHNWPLARIVSLHPGRDGIVRVVTILLRGRRTRRLTRMLYPLECE